MRRLALIAAAGLAARVLFVLLATDSADPAPASDRDFFLGAARLLSDGQGFLHPFVHEIGLRDAASAGHPPLWILTLVPLAKLGLLTPLSARLASCVAGAAAVLLVGLVARRMAGERAGMLAAALAAAYPAWIVADASGMTESLYVALVAGVVLALLAARDDARVRAGVAVGALVGLAALTRAEGLLLLPFAVWPLLWRHRRALAAATLAAVVVVAPWTIRNAVVLERFVPVSTNVDTVIAGANCDATYRGRDTGLWRLDCLAAATDLPPGATRYDEGRLAAGWREAGVEYARDNASRLPVVAAARIARAWRLWQPLREAELTEGVGRDAGRVAALSFLLLLAPAGLFGAITWRHDRRHLRLLLGLAAMVTVTCAVGWGAPRFLRPAEIGALVCAAALGSRLFRTSAS